MALATMKPDQPRSARWRDPGAGDPSPGLDRALTRAERQLRRGLKTRADRTRLARDLERIGQFRLREALRRILEDPLGVGIALGLATQQPGTLGGDSDDTVNLDGWAASGQTNQDGITYNVYTDTSGTLTQIWVQADVGHIVL